MRRWSVLLILALAALGLMVVGELTAEQPPLGEGAVVRLLTRTPTLTRTVGWWAEVATWTPTAVRNTSGEAAPTRTAEATPTPNLDIPPVRTLIPPTHGGAP